ncbi:MAG: DUF1214 domain-containing protein [Halieaceae bacterium]|jgi:hypothetical protein|nr:DUF1214 domain-containing protein [Halieaceae bacterium]
MNKEQLESVKAWEAFCDQLKVAGAVLARETTPADDLTQAEGLRKLVRMIRMGFEATLEYGNTDYPEVYQLVTPTTLGEGETSDSHYFQTMIDGSQSYRISGRRGGAPFIEFTVYAGKIGLDEHSAQVGAITEVDLEVDDDGNYELVLSPDKHAGNWIQTTADASVVFIRQYAHDWRETEDATFNIVRLGADGYRGPLTMGEVTAAMKRTTAYVTRSINTWAAIVDGARQAPVNQFITFPQDATDEAPEMPTGHRFSSGHFKLAADEALLVTFRPVDIPYWGIDINNYWFEPISYADHRSHYNNQTVQYEDDGSVRIVIANRNPGISNWIDTRGHLEGSCIMRWSRTNEPVPGIGTRVVSLADVK